MEAPTPINIENFQNTIFQQPFNEESSLSFENKEYILELDNISYKLKIYPDKNEINFKLDKNNELLHYYTSKYHFKDIISI